MSEQDESRKSTRPCWWSRLKFSYGPRPIDDLRAELRRLDARAPPTDASERDRRRFLKENELARTALEEELRRAEHLQVKPWLVYAPLVFWSTVIVTAIIIWLLVRS